jgi:type III secretory pathway component EscV
MTERRAPTRRGAAAVAREPEVAHLGPIPITVTGVLIAIALVGSLAYLAYTLTVRDTSQIPLLASGAVVLGLVFGAIAIVGARATWRSSVRGRDARAFGHAIVGGLAALVAAGCFAAAVILFLLGRPASG